MPDLPDLPAIMEACKTAVNAVDTTLPVTVREDVWERISGEFGAGQTTTIVDGKTLVVQNSKGQRNFMNAQELPVAKAVVPYLIALTEYNTALNGFSAALGFDSRTSGEGKSFFRQLPAANWEEILSARTQAEAPRAVLESMFDNALDVERMDHFLSDPAWSGIGTDTGGGRKFDRSTDWMSSGVLKVGNWVAAAASGRDKLVTGLYTIEDLDDAITQLPPGRAVAAPAPAAGSVTGGKNIIYYGAPGTGKSYRVDELSRNDEVFRTVFHPDVQNSDFFGTLKPSISDDGHVSYAFAPGAFANAMAYAVANPNHKTWLIIEELNRAPAAAVFGELFLLLDRNADGSGEYDVDCPSTEARGWFEEHDALIEGKLRIPPNLWIVATMNSADQGVYPLDTAFRRRWEQSYIPLEYTRGSEGSLTFVGIDGDNLDVEWRAFVETLNMHMAASGLVSEDRLVGPWFVKTSEFKASGEIPGKLLIYLWDDLFRTHGRECVFRTDSINTYGDLVSAMNDGRQIFSDALLGRFVADA